MFKLMDLFEDKDLTINVPKWMKIICVKRNNNVLTIKIRLYERLDNAIPTTKKYDAIRRAIIRNNMQKNIRPTGRNDRRGYRTVGNNY